MGGNGASIVRAVITGASSGIGEATALRLACEPGAELVLVARREDRLRRLADSLPCRASWVAVDLTEADAPRRVREHLAERQIGLNLLVNNAGASWRATFAEGGYANVRRTMEINFDAALRLTEALLPLLRDSAPSSIVNVASTAARVSRARAGAYSASKAALAAWSDALQLEEAPHGVRVALVMPGFIETEGFPAEELRARALTRWIVSRPERAAEAIVAASEGGGERYVPRPYALAAIARTLLPGVVRRVLSGGAGATLTTATAADRGSREA